MLEAQAAWSPQTSPLDVPLRSFSRACDIASKTSAFLGLLTAGAWVKGSLRTQAAKTVQPQLVDQFLGQLSFHHKNPDERAWITAQIRMFQAKPDPQPALAFFRRAADDPNPGAFVRFQMDSDVGRIRASIFWTILRVAQQLERDGHSSDSRWLLDFGKDRWPEHFTMKAPQFDKSEDQYDGRLHNYQRLLTNAERNSGRMPLAQRSQRYKVMQALERA